MMLYSAKTPTLFIPDPTTVANLYNDYPPANYVRMYAWVTDLHDGQPDNVVSDGTYWKPVRPFVVKSNANANTDMTLTTLKNAPTQIMRGTLTANRNISLSGTNVYPGAKFRIKREASGLFSMLVNSLTLPLNSWIDYEYDTANGWVQTASGGLL